MWIIFWRNKNGEAIEGQTPIEHSEKVNWKIVTINIKINKKTILFSCQLLKIVNNQKPRFKNNNKKIIFHILIGIWKYVLRIIMVKIFENNTLHTHIKKIEFSIPIFYPDQHFKSIKKIRLRHFKKKNQNSTFYSLVVRWKYLIERPHLMFGPQKIVFKGHPFIFWSICKKNIQKNPRFCGRSRIFFNI